jgi:mannose-6-phosphate isomerase
MVSRIASGWNAGRTLHDALQEAGPALMGRAVERFPLLLKVLDAERNLSVQVHPSAGYAADHAGAHLKTEAWYTPATRAGAHFLVGLRPGTTAQHLTDAVEQGDFGDLLESTTVAADDAVLIPSGTVHALGAGAVVFEVQTASDTTFRLNDWTRETGLPSRELKVEQALAAADLSLTPTWSRAAERGARTLVCTTAQFDLHAIARGRHDLHTWGHAGAALLFVRQEGSALQTALGSYAMPVGRITVLSASLLRGATVEPNGNGSVLIVLIR